MANHLTPEQIAAFTERRLSPADLEVLDGHMANCELCRQAVMDLRQLQAAYELLRSDLKRQEELGLTHISYEQLEAYLDNNIGPADREIIDSHLDLCTMCRAELRDLQEFHPSLESRDLAQNDSERPLAIYASADENRFSESADARQEVGFLLHPVFLTTVSVVAAFLIAISFLTVSQHTSPPTAHSLGSQMGASYSVPARLAQRELHLPAELTALIGKREILLSDSTKLPSFELLAPVGTFVDDLEPIFRWQPLSGSFRYQITVVDGDLREVLQSPKILGTSWKAGHMLERGKTYQWQVTAFRSSKRIVSPAPPAPEAKFKIIQQSDADALAQLKLIQPSNHFSLGYAYSNAGMLDRAETEFQLIPPSDPNYELAVKFLAELRALRQSSDAKQ